MKVRNSFLWLVLFVASILKAGDWQFDSRYSTVQITDNGTFTNNFPFDNWDGTLARASGGTISGEQISFVDGLLEDVGNQILLNAIFDPIGTIFLSGSTSFRAEPGRVLQTVSVSNSDNILRGSPIFSSAVALADASTTLTLGIQSQMNQNLVLNGGTVTLENDLIFTDGSIILGDGTINGNKYKVKTGGDPFTWTSNITWCTSIELSTCVDFTGSFTFSEASSTINGNGYVLDLTGGGVVTVGSGVTLTLSDIVIKGLGNGAGFGKILLTDVTSTLVLTNVTLLFSDDFTTSVGDVEVKGPTTAVVKDHDWLFDMTSTLTVDCLTLWKDTAGAETCGDILFESASNMGLINDGTIDYITLRCHSIIEGLDSCCDVLDSRVDILESCCEANDSRLDIVESCCEANDSRLDIVESCCDALDSRTDILESCCEANDSRIDIVESCCDVLDSRVDVIESEVDTFDSRIDILESCCEANDSRLDIVESCCDVLDSRVDVLESEVDTFDSRIDILESCCEANDSRLDIVESCCDVLDSRVDILESEVDTFDSRIDVVESCCEANDSRLDIVESCCDVLDSRVDILESEIEELSNDDSRLDILESCCEANDSRLDIVESCCDVLDSRVDVLESEIDETVVSLPDDLDSRLDVLESCCEANDSRLDIVESCCDVLDSRVDILESEIEELVDDDSRLDILESCCEANDSRIDILESEIDEIVVSLPDDLESRLDLLESCCEVLDSRVDVLESEIDTIITQTCVIPVCGDVKFDLSMLPGEGEAVLYEFCKCYESKLNPPSVIFDPACFGNNGCVELPKGSRLAFCGFGTVELKDGVTFKFTGTACDGMGIQSDWPELLLDECACMVLDMNATVTIGGGEDGAGCINLRKGGSILLDQSNSHLIFGQACKNELIIHASLGSHITVNNSSALISYHLGTFDLIFDNHSTLQISDGTIEMNTINCFESPGVIRKFEFLNDSCLVLPGQCNKSLGVLRLAPNDPNSCCVPTNSQNVMFNNLEGQVCGNGDLQFVSFDNAGNKVVNSTTRIQNNQFCITAPMVEVFMELSYLLDPGLIPPPDATILALQGTRPDLAQCGRLVAFCPSRDGSMVGLSQGDHDVFYDSSESCGTLDLVRGYDRLGRVFTIADCNENTRTPDAPPTT